MGDGLTATGVEGVNFAFYGLLQGAVPCERDVASDADIGARAFALPSLCEGFDILLPEAFAGGISMAGSKATALPEVAGGAALEVDPLDVGAMTDAIIALCGSEPDRHALTTRGRAFSVQLSVGRAVARTLEVREGLIAKRQRACRG